MFGRPPNKPRMRGQRPRVIYVSVGHAGAGETHAGRNGEGELAAGPGCHEGEWSHTGVTGTHRHIRIQVSEYHPGTVIPTGHPCLHRTGTHLSAE